MVFDLQFVDSIGQIYDPITDTFTRYVPTALNANPFFETDVSNWTPTGGTFVRSTAQFHEGIASGLLTPDGVTAIVRVECAAASGAVAGQSYSASAWVRCAVARDVQITINWFDAGGTYLSTSSAAPVAVAANTWTLLQFVAVAPATTGMVSMNVQMSGTPLVSHLLYIDEARLTTGGGWGTADTGQVWTTSGGSAPDFSVDGTKGLQSLGTVNVLRNSLVDVGFTDGTVTVDIVNPVVPTGASITHWVVIRAADLSNYYVARLDIPTGAVATLSLSKRVGGTLTGLTSSVSVGLHAAPTKWRVVFDVNGSTLRAKAWRSDLVAEPAGWQVAATDTALTSGTQAGMLARLETGNTNTLPVDIVSDNFSVTSPTQVRLDLNDDLPWRTLGEGTEFGTPPLRRAVVSTLMQDGEHVPAAAYGNRMLTLTLDCQLADFDGAAAAFQELSRELDRPGNFLRYRPGTTEPVFFRTLRSDFTSVVWDAVLRRASVSVLAEPFAYGLPEFLPSVTVANDPAAVTNPMYFDVTGIKGDVPAVTKIQTNLAFYNNRMMLATRRRGTPANLQAAYQAEAMTQGTDTTTQPNDATMSGSGNNFSRCTFATATMQTRLTLAAFPSASSVDGRGTYRVLARVRKSVAADAINLRLQVVPAGSGVGQTLSTVATLTTTTSPYHADLGLVSAPFGTDPVTDGPSGLQLDAAQYAVRLQAERVSGTGTLDIDYLLFIPADDELAFVEFGAGSAGDGYVFDSHHDMVYAVKAGAVDTSADIIPVAGLPTLRPGVTNRIYIVQGVDVTEAVTATCTAAVTTWPRYVNVRGTS